MISATPQPGIYHVWCDTSTCPYGISVEVRHPDAARAATAALGWTHTEDLSHCPGCSSARGRGNPSSLMGFNHDATPTHGHDQDPPRTRSDAS
ncbi:hypothetical protein GCM10009734_90750 [Nonomuraea bangladeshensis]